MRRVLSFLRTVHIYLSMLGLVLIAFFAVTGFMLNHEKWFRPDEIRAVSTRSGVVSRSLIPPDAKAEQNVSPEAERRIEDELRRVFQIRGHRESVVVNEEGIDVIFESPGHVLTASVPFDADESKGELRAVLKDESTGFVGRICELHKKATSNGAAWRWIVDGVIVVLLISAVSGVVMCVAISKRRWLGIAAMVSGAAILVAVYVVLAP